VILNIYKEANWTSFDVVAKLRSILKTKHIGHAGTLDPLAEGVLVVLTGDDTKKQDTIMGKTKEYLAEIGLGVSTASWDLEFQPDYVGDTPSGEAVLSAIDGFKGLIQQQIPLYSAKKIQGKELYKYARQGKIPDIPLPSKQVTIHKFEVKSIDKRKVMTNQGEKEILVFECRISCSSGTYIRSIAHELGEKLGTGGVLLKLIRTKVGDYCVEDAKKLSELES